MQEKIEEEIKQLSNGKCVICHKSTSKCWILDENKPIEKENLIMLCTKCADHYIGNLELSKQLKQKREYWYKQVKEAVTKTGNTDILVLNEEKDDDNSPKVAIYHVVYENEGFYESAQHLFELLKGAQHDMENTKRHLYLDIDGHTDSYGRFDEEMTELLQNFIMEVLLPYFYEIHTPLLNVRNTEPQRNDIPDNFVILDTQNDIINFFNKEVSGGGYVLEKMKKQYGDDIKKLIYKRI